MARGPKRAILPSSGRAYRARLDHQALQVEDRVYAPGIPMSTARTLQQVVKVYAGRHSLSRPMALRAIILDDELWQTEVASTVDAASGSAAIDSQQWVNSQRRRLGLIAEDTETYASSRNIWTVVQKTAKNGHSRVQAPRASPTPRKKPAHGFVYGLGCLVSKVADAQLPKGLPQAPTYVGPEPFAIWEQGSRGGATIVDGSTMQEYALPPVSPRFASLEAWWSYILETSTPAHIDNSKIPGASGASLAAITAAAKSNGGVCLVDREELKARRERVSIYTDVIPAVTSSHPQAALVVHAPLRRPAKLYLLSASALASVFDVPLEPDRLRRALSAVSDAEARAMLGNGVNALDCGRQMHEILRSMAWKPGVRVKAAGMCDGCGCMIGCLQRAVGEDLRINFLSDVAATAASALHAGFGDITERILGSAHRPEDQAAMVELGQVDILCAGFPCTPISNANRRSTLYAEAGRHIPIRREQLELLLSLIWTSLEYAEKTRPRFVLFETVGALRDTLEMRQVFLRLEAILHARLPGYAWKYTRSNATEAGSMNERDRLWIRGEAPSARALAAAISAMDAVSGMGITFRRFALSTLEAQGL